MPFDGSSISQELRLLDGLLEFFEEDDSWVQEMFSDGEGRSCLVDALRLTRQRLGIKHDRTRAYLTRAIRQHHRGGRLQAFNDYLCSGIEELRDTIRFACALATAYPPDRLPYAPATPTRYSPSSKPSVHGLANLERRPSMAAGCQLELALG
jgi:hypothetical protein